MHHDNGNSNSAPDPGNIGAPMHLEELKSMGVDPAKSTPARPGSEEKVRMLSARYTAGVALWDARDRCDHGPTESELMGDLSDAIPQPLPLPDSTTHRKTN